MNLPAHWVNAVHGALIAPNDRGFTYGDALFETLRFHNGRLHLWHYHWQRLQQGLQRLDIDCPRTRIEAQLEQSRQFLADKGIADAVGRLAVSRGSGSRGYRPGRGEPNLVMSLTDAPAWRQPAAALRLTLCETRLARQPALAGIKHANRLEQVLGAAEVAALEGVDEGLQLDPDGMLVCATAANLFLVVQGELLTPPVEDCGIAGTVRQLILDELAPAAGLALRVTPIEASMLAAAEEVFLTNAVTGIRAVGNCDAHVFTATQCGDNLRSRFYAWSDANAW